MYTLKLYINHDMRDVQFASTKEERADIVNAWYIFGGNGVEVYIDISELELKAKQPEKKPCTQPEKIFRENGRYSNPQFS